MITGGFGVSVVLGNNGQHSTRQWYVRADGVKRWADNDQPCEPQHQDPVTPPSNSSFLNGKKPVCAVDGVLHGGQALCGQASVGSNKRCNSATHCEHQQEGN